MIELCTGPVRLIHESDLKTFEPPKMGRPPKATANGKKKDGKK
jgi:hypothetical protein